MLHRCARPASVRLITFRAGLDVSHPWLAECLKPHVITPTLALIMIFSQVPGAASNAAWNVLDKSLAESASRRQQALAAIATIGEPNPTAVRKAEEALNDKDALVRQAAALALGELNAADAIPALKKSLVDTPEVAFAAAKSLTKLGDPSGRDVVVAVLAGERKGGPGMVTNAVRKAKGDLHHPEGLVIMGAKDATSAMFPPAGMVIPVAKDTLDLKSKGAPGRAAAAAYLALDPDPYAITLLEWALNDDSAMVRMEAARDLGERGNSGSVEKLQAALNDEHTAVRDFAAAAIIRINDRKGEAGAVSTCKPNPQVSRKK